MRCSQAKLLVSRRLDEDTSGRDLIALEAHLAECPECSVLAEDLRRILAGLRSLSTEPAPGSLAASVAARIAQQSTRRRGWGRVAVGLYPLRKSLVAGTSVGILVILGAWFAAVHARTQLQNARFVEHTVTTTAAQTIAIAASDPLEDVGITNALQHGYLAGEGKDAL